MNIVKNIPNAVTSMNLLCGLMGVICTFGGDFRAAFIFMMAAAVCDFCDGLTARLLKAHSELGKELDSLADMVSFGVLPSLMTYKLMTAVSGNSLLAFTPLLIGVFSALRLAKFNIGLATPACAMICGSFAYYVTNDTSSVLHGWASSKFFIPTASVVLSLLLVSEIPMFSMKFKKKAKPGTPIHRQRVSFLGVVFVSTIMTVLLGLNWSFIVLLSFVAYIIMNIGIALLFRQK